MKKKLVGFVIIALIALLATFFFIKTREEWEWYENNEQGFRIKYPSDWKKREEKTESYFKVDFKKERGGPIAFFSVEIWPSTPEEREKSSYESIKEGVEFFQKAACKEDFTFKVSEIKNAPLDGVPATKVLWLMKIEEISYKQLIICVILEDNTTYYLGYSSKEEYFDKYLPVVEEMIEFFDFVEADK
jgi:hypothetical protein